MQPHLELRTVVTTPAMQQHAAHQSRGESRDRGRGKHGKRLPAHDVDALRRAAFRNLLGPKGVTSSSERAVPACTQRKLYGMRPKNTERKNFGSGTPTIGDVMLRVSVNRKVK